jgi:Ca2+-transporting ATPase
MTMQGQRQQMIRRVSAILRQAVKNFWRIDGAQWAGAFAHYAFFALFPVIILFVTLASIFIDRDQAGAQIIAFVETYVPIGDAKQRYIFDTLAGVINARAPASAVAFVMLAWAVVRFLATLIRATNRAWGIEAHDWWRLPLKSLAFLAIIVIGVPLGLTVPVLAKIARNWLSPVHDFSSWIYTLGSFFIPVLALFLSLNLLYSLAPRRYTRFAEVWVGAACATVLLKATESLFGMYLRDVASLNVVYGAFGAIMALLLWIYLSGGILIFGACLCAAQAAERSAPAQTTMTRTIE